MRETRQRLGLSQQALAQVFGVSRSTVNRIEQGRQKPHPQLQAMIEVWLERNQNGTRLDVE